MRRVRHGTCALGLLAILSGVSGCDQQRGPRELPFPTFDAKQPFPELTGEEVPEGDGVTNPEDVDQTSFEEAIRDAGGTETADPERPETTGTQSVQIVSLASIFHADVPVLFDEWQYATDGVSTLITHRKPGSLPDAIIYIEAFSPAVEFFPSYEVGRFQFTVDPGLSPNIVYPPLVLLGYEWAKTQTAPPLDVLLTLQMATTRTMGMGLGYSSTRSTFTGWKWVGKTSSGLEARFGRTSGRWDAPAFPGQRRAEEILKELAEQIPGAGGLVSQIEQTRELSRGVRRVPSAAWMVLGSVRRENNPTMGVHIAVLCERKPVCPVSEEIADFISSVRVPEEGATLAAPAGDLMGFSEGIGVNLLGPQDVISAPQMISLLQQAMNQKKEGDKPGAVPGLPSIPGTELIPGAGGPAGTTPGGTPTTITLPDGTTREITLPPGVELPSGFPGGAPPGLGLPTPTTPTPGPIIPGGSPSPGGATPTPTEPAPAEPGQPIPIPE